MQNCKLAGHCTEDLLLKYPGDHLLFFTKAFPSSLDLPFPVVVQLYADLHGSIIFWTAICGSFRSYKAKSRTLFV